MEREIESRRFSLAVLVALLFSAIFLLHIRLLHLPYFWDEAGYYIPAARDILLSGSLIPRSTISNAHPPLVLAYLALAWKMAGYSPVVTRTALLLVAAFTLAGVFRLAKRAANTEVAIASTLCTALHPVFFAQSSLAHLDLAAAGLTFWGLLEFIDGHKGRAAAWFSLAVLAKETAILAPLALLVWDLASRYFQFDESHSFSVVSKCRRSSFVLLVPILPLGFWYVFHYARTGIVFGNPEFFRYNVGQTLQPLRIILALGMRLWQVLVYMNMYVLTIPALLAIWLPPVHDGAKGSARRRIAFSVQLAFVAVIGAYVVAMALVGGAVLARYMLPATPLVIILCVSTLHRRLRLWTVVVGIVAAAFLAGLVVNPSYGFAMEDNLAYRDYVQMHQRAETVLETRYPSARVLTAWPASDELTRPYLGYVVQPIKVVRIEDFTVQELMSAAEIRSGFDVALVFSTKYEPRHPWFTAWHPWQEWKARFFGYHRDVPPAAAAQILGGHLVYADSRAGQWIAIVELERVEEAQGSTRPIAEPDRRGFYCPNLARMTPITTPPTAPAPRIGP